MFYFSVIALLLLCSLCSCDLIQAPSMETAAGIDVNLTCDHPSLTTSDYIHWYKLSPGQGPLFLISGYKDNLEKKFSLLFESGGRKSSVLVIRNIEPKDSAVYLCAKSDTAGNKLIFGDGTRLHVIPKTPRQLPFAYKLSSKIVGNLTNSVCLITDFPSPNKTLTIDGEDVNLNEVAVLDNSTNNVWRYSTVIWDDNKNVTCVGKYDSESFTATDDTEETCSSISIDENFRTNPSLNTISLTVLGLRVLTAKAIVFNLIITLRLWSS